MPLMPHIERALTTPSAWSPVDAETTRVKHAPAARWKKCSAPRALNNPSTYSLSSLTKFNVYDDEVDSQEARSGGVCCTLFRCGSRDPSNRDCVESTRSFKVEIRDVQSLNWEFSVALRYTTEQRRPLSIVLSKKEGRNSRTPCAETCQNGSRFRTLSVDSVQYMVHGGGDETEGIRRK